MSPCLPAWCPAPGPHCSQPEPHRCAAHQRGTQLTPPSCGVPMFSLQHPGCTPTWPVLEGTPMLGQHWARLCSVLSPGGRGWPHPSFCLTCVVMRVLSARTCVPVCHREGEHGEVQNLHRTGDPGMEGPSGWWSSPCFLGGKPTQKWRWSPPSQPASRVWGPGTDSAAGPPWRGSHSGRTGVGNARRGRGGRLC